MLSFRDILIGFMDTLTGHLVMAVYLMVVTDERMIWRQLKKLLFLLPSPLLAVLISAGLYAVSASGIYHYYIISSISLAMCTIWVWRMWRLEFWQAFAATCMAGVFQVANATLSSMVPIALAPGLCLHVGSSIAVALLLYRLRFGKWFRLLLDNESASWRTALLLFALEATMEVFLFLARVVQPQYLPFYYLLMAVMVALMTALIIYLAQRFDAARRIQMQRDVIAQQRLYEQSLEDIRREVRAFRHDCKNLLAGLSLQEEGELEGLRRALARLDAGFDQRLGKKIQASAQIGNLQIPEVRSLLLSKLAVMGEKGVACRLEALYPVTEVDMDVWDFVRCLGILTDNAMEAALETEQPWVEIVLLAQDGRLFLRVSNPYGNTIEPEKMWREGWSTKGADRGVGLSGYRRMVENYPGASTCTSWENGVFVQELTVEGRP